MADTRPDRPRRLAGLGPAMHAPMPVRPFVDPSLIWVNDRWLMAQGVNVTLPEIRNRVDRWLLEQFAWGSPARHDPEDLYARTERPVGADRYGANRGSLHGGSGRTATFGRFNVKGVGRTPLVAENVDWYHSHGCLWLEEAIREAIASEVCAREFPHGAIPVVAIIDTGTRIYWDDGSTGERRALIVRPNFIRLAHFQRSLFFGDAGRPDSAQFLDAKRTREAFLGLDPNEPTLATALTRAAVQCGYGQASRLWTGPFLSSNATLGGEVADFGSFRSLPNWQRTHGAARDPAFGEEDKSLQQCAASLAVHARKYGRPSDRLPPLNFREAIGLGRRIAFRRHLGTSPEADRVFGLLEEVMELDQRIRNLTPDIAPAHHLSTRYRHCHRSDRQLSAVADITREAGPRFARAVAMMLKRRPLLERERLLSITQAVIGDLPSAPMLARAKVTSFIHRVINRSVGASSLASEGLMPLRWHFGHSSFVFGERLDTGGRTLAIEAPICGHEVVVFGCSIPIGSFDVPDAQFIAGRVRFTVPQESPECPADLRIGGNLVPLPLAQEPGSHTLKRRS